MSFSSRLLTIALALSATTGIASATTITLDSYGSVNSTGSTTAGVGAGNTALKFAGYSGNGYATPSSAATYNLPTASPWASIPSSVAGSANSSWVSLNAGDYPGGSSVEPGGVYIYLTSFTASATSTGTITVLADDSTSLYLNSTQITGAASLVGAANCTVGTPNCLVATTYTLTGFVNGTNTLGFGVTQDFASATGVDFAGTVTTAATPEPSSLILLGTGILGAAGAARRRLARS